MTNCNVVIFTTPVDLSGQLSNLSESLDEFFEELEVLTSAPTAPQLSAGSPLPNVAGGAE